MSSAPQLALPDIANETQPQLAGALDWVGMSEIDLPVRIADAQGVLMHVPARVAAFVNLENAESRGIHMSRLYLLLDRMLGEAALSPCSVRHVLKEFLASHTELSSRARLRISFDYLVRRPALVSDNSGWRAYPVVITGTLDRGQYTVETELEVTYSSTCPCSAALARQLVQEQFRADFSAAETLDRDQVLAWLGTEQGMAATPHSQRSVAALRVRLIPSFETFPLIELINSVESALQTAVQTAVKREDEQAFARLNASNLMFCEDAARRIKVALNALTPVLDFHVQASHFESLHPHNAVAVATKGVSGGYVG